MSESEGSEESLEEGSDVSGDISDGEMSGEDETDSEDMMTLPSVEGAGSEEAGSDVEDETLGDAGADTDGKGLEFKVVPLEKGTLEYEAAIAYVNGLNDGSSLLLVRVLSYGMYYNGRELNLEACQVTADIEPASELSNKAGESIPNAITYLREEGEIAEAPEDPAEDELQTEFTISALKMVDSEKAEEVSSVYLSEKNPAEKMTVTLEDGIAIVSAQTQANPKFTVQYYANLEKVAYNDDNLKVNIDSANTNELMVIDTDGGKLPVNGKGKDASPNENAIRKLYVDTQTGKLKTKTELTKVYEERPYEYHKAPTINYINALIENASYKLKKVWVLKEGKEPTSTKEEDWVSYPYDENLHFTNRELSGGTEDGETYVYIKEGAVIRLVYDTTQTDKDFEAAFYDYDIGDGKIYNNLADAQNGKNSKPTSNQEFDKEQYMRTGQQGINNPGNYAGSGAKLAFGNSNSGSGLQHEQWSGNLLNKNNSTQGGHPAVSGSYKGCTFGLVKSLVKGEVQYADGVIAPNL